MAPLKAFALITVLVGGTLARPTFLEERGDQDLTYDDLNVLFGRDADFDVSPLDSVPYKRGLSKFIKAGIKTIVGNSDKIMSAANAGLNVASAATAVRDQYLQNKNQQIINQQMTAGGYAPGFQRRFVDEDDEELLVLARDLEAYEDELDMLLYSRSPSGFWQETPEQALKEWKLRNPPQGLQRKRTETTLNTQNQPEKAQKAKESKPSGEGQNDSKSCNCQKNNGNTPSSSPSVPVPPPKKTPEQKQQPKGQQSAVNRERPAGMRSDLAITYNPNRDRINRGEKGIFPTDVSITLPPRDLSDDEYADGLTPLLHARWLSSLKDAEGYRRAVGGFDVNHLRNQQRLRFGYKNPLEDSPHPFGP